MRETDVLNGTGDAKTGEPLNDTASLRATNPIRDSVNQLRRYQPGGGYLLTGNHPERTNASKAKAKARRTLSLSAPEAAKKLVEIIRIKSNDVRILAIQERAASQILDRVLGKPGTTIEVTDSRPINLPSELMLAALGSVTEAPVIAKEPSDKAKQIVIEQAISLGITGPGIRNGQGIVPAVRRAGNAGGEKATGAKDEAGPGIPPLKNPGQNSGDGLKNPGQNSGDGLKNPGQNSGDNPQDSGKIFGNNREISGEDGQKIIKEVIGLPTEKEIENEIEKFLEKNIGGDDD